MDPQEEFRSLQENPLPPDPSLPATDVISTEDKMLPTRIAAVDHNIEIALKEVERIEERLRDLRSSRTLLLERALSVGIMEDPRFSITRASCRSERTPDIEKMKRDLPVSAWKSYLKAMKEKAKRDSEASLNKALMSINTDVNLGIADKIFGKKEVTACCKVTETVVYSVVKK